MYIVTLHDDHADKNGVVIHDSSLSDVKLSSGKIKNVLGAVHDFTFEININNPAWGKVKPYKSIVEVYDTFNKKIIFEGRALKPEKTMGSDGMVREKVTCESLLAYLVDSSQRHAEIHDSTVRDFLQIIIDNHNRQVEEHKKFTLREVTVTNTTDNVYRYLGYDNTYKTMQDKLIDRLGGYLQAEKVNDVLYLDYLEDIGSYIESTPIEIAHNMKDVSYEVDPTEIITRIVPLGVSVESEDEGATDASQARLTIAGINGGIDYLDDEELIEEFGIIEKTVVWDDVTTPQRLMTNGINYLNTQKVAILRLKVNALNTFLIGKDVSSFELGNYHDLINPLIGLNEKVQIIAKEIDINNPANSTLEIGDKTRTLTDYQKNMRATEKNVTELKNIVENQTKRIASIRTELETVDNTVEQLQQAIVDADIPELEGAVSDLVDAVANLTDAVDNIPDYDLATQTSDGLMSKEDKAKLDRLIVTATTNIDSIRNKLELITVDSQVDLNDMLERIEALEEE